MWFFNASVAKSDDSFSRNFFIPTRHVGVLGFFDAVATF